MLNDGHGLALDAGFRRTAAEDKLAPRWWIVCLLALATTIDYRVSAGAGPSFAVTELAAFLALLLLFLDTVVRPRATGWLISQSFEANKWVMIYFAWCWAMAWVGLTRSAEAFFAFRNLFPSLVVYTFVVSGVRTIREVKIVLWVVIAGALLNLGLGAIQKVHGGPYPNALHASVMIKMDLEGGFVTNSPTGFFVHPNGLAVFLIPINLFLVHAGLFLVRSSWARIGCLLLAVFGFAIHWFTYTKGAVLWALVATALLFLPRWSAPKRLAAGWVVLVGLIAAIVLLSVENKFTGYRALNSMSTRLEIWNSALHALVENPWILAIGNGFRDVYFQTLRLSEMVYLNAHNTVINQVVFFGLPALLAYLLLIGRALRSAAAASLEPDGDRSDRLAWFCFCALVGLVGEHFFEPVLDSVVLQAQFFLLIGLTHALARAKRNST